MYGCKSFILIEAYIPGYCDPEMGGSASTYPKTLPSNKSLFPFINSYLSMNRLERYELMKGNKDLLEGRVLGYVEADPPISGSQYPGMYASININDLQPYIKEMAMLCGGHVSFCKFQFIGRE